MASACRRDGEKPSKGCQGKPDLILLPMLSKMDGFQSTGAEVQEDTNSIPIIILSKGGRRKPSNGSGLIHI